MSRSARGFSAVSAVIVLVMLAVFGTALVTTSVTQQSGAALDLLSPKAYQAARAGVEYGLHRALVGGTCAATDSITFIGDLAGFRADITCSSTSHTEATATPMTVFHVVATGCNDAAGCPAATPAGPHYVERQLRASAASN